jgi:hypothetical protein
MLIGDIRNRFIKIFHDVGGLVKGWLLYEGGSVLLGGKWL